MQKRVIYSTQGLVLTQHTVHSKCSSERKGKKSLKIKKSVHLHTRIHRNVKQGKAWSGKTQVRLPGQSEVLYVLVK